MSARPRRAAGGEVVSVVGRATATAGRFIVSAGRNHLVSDARAGVGGPGEAVNAGELLLAALASCGLALVQKAAAERRVRLDAPAVAVSFKRDASDATRYEYIRIEFDLPRVTRAAGQALLEAFTGHCPIYNTLKRGGRVEATLADRRLR
jgi:uncharacterized OsmC-like protein